MHLVSPILAGVLGLGGPELIVIFAIFMLLFGGSKLPGLAKGLGQSIKEFKKASRDEPEPVPGTAPHIVPAAKPVEKPATADGKA